MFNIVPNILCHFVKSFIICPYTISSCILVTRYRVVFAFILDLLPSCI